MSGQACLEEPYLTRDSRLAVVMLISHVAVVAVFTAVLAVTLRGLVIGANIGAGLVMLAIAVLGMPWSLLVLNGVISEERDFAETSLFITFALANVLIHGLLALWLTRSRRSN